MPHSRSFLSFTTVALLAACTADRPARPYWTTTIDTLSSGAVRVHHAPPPDPAATWGLEPELRIGSLEGSDAEVFGDIRDFAVTADGRIVVLDAQAQELRVFGPDGGHLATFGGKGGGPGEYQGANGVAIGPDGLIRVFDPRNRRVSLVDPAAGFVRSYVFEQSYGGYRWDGVVDSAGRAWTLDYLRTGAPMETRYAYVEQSPDGTYGDTLFQPRPPRRSGEERPGWWTTSTGTASVLNLGVPFYAQARFVLSPSVHIWSTPDGDPSYRLIRWNQAGDTALILEVDRPPVPTPMGRADSLVTQWEERFDVSLDRSKIPDLAPLVSGFFFDDSGRVWVHVYSNDYSVYTFDAFAAGDGAYLGTLVSDTRVLGQPEPVVRGDTLWGVIRDEMGVQYVVRARLVDAKEVDG